MSPASKPMTARRPARARVPGFPAVPPVEGVQETVGDPKAVEPAEIALDPARPQAPEAPLPPREPAVAAGGSAPVPATVVAARPKPDRGSRDAAQAQPGDVRTAGATTGAVKPGGARTQTNLRFYESEMQHLRRLKREFEDDGIKTDITELVHAIVYATRRGELDPLEILRRWRTDLNEF